MDFGPIREKSASSDSLCWPEKGGVRGRHRLLGDVPHPPARRAGSRLSLMFTTGGTARSRPLDREEAVATAQQEPGYSLAEAVARPRERFRPWTPPTKDGGWRLVVSRTTSNAWLYSTRTGRVYRVLAKCPQGTLAGCLMPLPVVYGPHHSDDLPSAGDED